MADLADVTAVLNTEQAYFLVENRRFEQHSVQLVHHDATTAGGWTLYSSNQDDVAVPADGAAAVPNPEHWSLETVTVTDPAGTAAGSFMLHLSASTAKRYLVRFLATAASSVSVFAHGKD
jgi:hypothetical protein